MRSYIEIAIFIVLAVVLANRLEAWGGLPGYIAISLGTVVGIGAMFGYRAIQSRQ